LELCQRRGLGKLGDRGEHPPLKAFIVEAGPEFAVLGLQALQFGVHSIRQIVMASGTERLAEPRPVLDAAVVESLQHALGVLARYRNEPEHRLLERGAICVVPGRKNQRPDLLALVEVVGERRAWCLDERAQPSRGIRVALVPCRDR
jgi:hypothetical protein